MGTRSSDIADFYQQLALLVRSNLPLPHSLRQLGRDFPKPQFQDLLLGMSDRIAGGEKLSQAMRSYPQFFDPLHIRLVSAGEATGTLPETLFAVARFARFCQLVAAQMRNIVAYPLLTMHLCLIVVLFISIMVIPEFRMIFDELLEGARLPPLTKLVLSTGMFISNHRMFCVLAYLILLGFSLWIFSPALAAHRVLLVMVNAMPGSLKIVHSLDSARLCTLWSTFLRQGMPMHDAVETSAQIMDRSRLRQALQDVARKLQSGTAIAEALAGESAVDRLIVLTFEHAAEKELPDELAQLGELFEHRVTLAVRSANAVWTVVAFLLTTLVVGSVIVAMFAPLISIVTMFGGY